MALNTKTANGIKYPIGSDTLNIGHFKEMAESIEEKIGAPKGLETKYESFADVPHDKPGMYLVSSTASDAPIKGSSTDWVALQASGQNFTIYAFSATSSRPRIFYHDRKDNGELSSGPWSHCITNTQVINNLTTGGTEQPLSAEQGKALKNLIDNVEGAILPTFETFAKANESPSTGHTGLCLVNGKASDAPFPAATDWILLHSSGSNIVQYAFSPQGNSESLLGNTEQAVIYYRGAVYEGDEISWSEWHTLLRSEDIVNDYSGGINKILSAEKGKELKGLIDRIEGIQDLGTITIKNESLIQFADARGIYYFRDQYSFSGFLFAPGKKTELSYDHQYCLYKGTLWIGLIEGSTVTWYKYGVNKSEVLTKTNTTAYTPTADYHPSTKKYVDDAITGIISGDHVFQEIEVTVSPLNRPAIFSDLQEGAYHYSVSENAETGYLFAFMTYQPEPKVVQLLTGQAGLYHRMFSSGNSNDVSFNQISWTSENVVRETTINNSPLAEASVFLDYNHYPNGIYRFQSMTDLENFGYLFVASLDQKISQTMILANKIYTRNLEKKTGGFPVPTDWTEIGSGGSAVTKLEKVQQVSCTSLDNKGEWNITESGIYLMHEGTADNYLPLLVSQSSENPYIITQYRFHSNMIEFRQYDKGAAYWSEWNKIGGKTAGYDIIIGNSDTGDTTADCDILLDSTIDIISVLNSSQVPSNSSIFLKNGYYTVGQDATINKTLKITGEGDAFNQDTYIEGQDYTLTLQSKIDIENCAFNVKLSFDSNASCIEKCYFKNEVICTSITTPSKNPTIFRDNLFDSSTALTIEGANTVAYRSSIVVDNNRFISDTMLQVNNRDVANLQITNNDFGNGTLLLGYGVGVGSGRGYITNNRRIGILDIGEAAKGLNITNNTINLLTLSQSTDPTISKGVEISNNDFTSNISTVDVKTIGCYSKFIGNRINYKDNTPWNMSNFQTGNRPGAVVGGNMINGKMDKLVFLNGAEIGISPVTYGVSIDLSNSNPETSVTYTDDAVGMVAGASSWWDTQMFSKIRPCLFKDGKVVGYLDPNNFSQFMDGSEADLVTGDAGDVMIEIPKIGYKISKSGTTLTVQITDESNKEGFSYKAHTRTTEGDRDKLYIGAFLGSTQNGKLRSILDAFPQHNTSLANFRTQAQANGTGYDLLSFYPLTLLQCLYLIMYKNLNPQSALGLGYVGGPEVATTGATFNKGMNYGSPDSNTTQVKFLGIEDFWGNLYQFIDGLVSTSDLHALVATDNFNDTGNGYTDLGVLPAVNGYMKEPQGNNEMGFIEASSGGSATTYFSDYADFQKSGVTCFGGHHNSGIIAGAFQLRVSHRSEANGNIGGRLMFL